MKQFIKTRFFRIIVGVVGIMGIIFLTGKPLLILGYRSNAQWVTRSFWSSLHKNDEVIAKGVTDTKHWEFIESWMIKHEVTECGEWLTEGPTSVGTFSGDKWVSSTSLNCRTKTGDQYCFAIFGMVAEKTERGWIVVEWKEITESCER
jgi:hypothetical protein